MVFSMNVINIFIMICILLPYAFAVDTSDTPLLRGLRRQSTLQASTSQILPTLVKNEVDAGK